ncbi:Protein F09A5.2 [Aphelenchoides avenae]|nr:Protein F09A5.2 [Aphelenchus avenae]
MLRELELMKVLSENAHVLRLLAFVDPQDQPPVLVLEFCANGNLQAFLRSHLSTFKHSVTSADEALQSDMYLNTNLTLRDLISFCWQISDGMMFIASKGYVHRDLAARNVLVTASRSVKVADFGLCRFTDEAVYTAHLGSKMPIKWMSPESLKRAEFNEKTDV